MVINIPYQLLKQPFKLSLLHVSGLYINTIDKCITDYNDAYSLNFILTQTVTVFVTYVFINIVKRHIIPLLMQPLLLLS